MSASACRAPAATRVSTSRRASTVSRFWGSDEPAGAGLSWAAHCPRAERAVRGGSDAVAPVRRAGRGAGMPASRRSDPVGPPPPRGQVRGRNAIEPCTAPVGMVNTPLVLCTGAWAAHMSGFGQSLGTLTSNDDNCELRSRNEGVDCRRPTEWVARGWEVTSHSPVSMSSALARRALRGQRRRGPEGIGRPASYFDLN
jgi:hypothetical protein